MESNPQGNSLTEEHKKKTKLHNPRHGTVPSTILNTICCSIGGGILSLALAMHKASIILGTILIAISGFFSAFACFSIVSANEVTQRYTYHEALAHSVFPDEPHEDAVAARKAALQANTANGESESLTEASLYDNESVCTLATVDLSAHCAEQHKKRRWLVVLIEVFIAFNNFGALIIYSRVIGDSVPIILESFFHAKGVVVQKWFWYVIPSFFFNVFMCARSITELKFVSLVGFLTILYLVVLVIIRSFMNIHSPYITDEGHNKYRVIGFKMALFSTIGSFALSYSCHYSVPYMYGELVDRRVEVFTKAAVIASSCITACYYLTALMGYLLFGYVIASAKAGGSIMNSFRDDDVSANIARVLLFFHFMAVYPVVGFSGRRGLHKLLCLIFVKTKTYDDTGKLIPVGDHSITSWPAIIIEATVMVWLATVISYFVTGVGVVIDLVGILFSTPLMLIFPGIMGICVFKKNVVDYSASKIKVLRILSWISTVLGSIFLILALISFCLERAHVGDA